MDNTVGSQQENIICGTLLGDGLLERNGRFVRLVVDHGASQEAYVRWKAGGLMPLPSSVTLKKRIDPRNQQTYMHCILRTHTDPLLERFVSLFYKERQKCIPENLPRMINPQMLAVWIMDDGYRRNDCNALRLNTQCYTFAEQEVIQQSLAKLSISSNIQKHKMHFVVYVPSRSMSRLRTLIPSMVYKLA
jgi:hypothetical protein